MLTHVLAQAQHMDFVARNTYNASADRDPVPCLIFYFALRKRRLVHGLWKQAVGHPDRANMLKFLVNDFDEPRWQTAARKNAYSLLSKQRFGKPFSLLFMRWSKRSSHALIDLAASFFLLGDCLADAVSVCLRHLRDFQLAIAIARVYEGSDTGPVLRNLLETHVAAIALGQGHRWLSSWTFWMLKRRDLAVRVIVSPFKDMALELPFRIHAVGEPNTDDPALVLLLGQIRDRSLQTIKGATYIGTSTEYKVSSFHSQTCFLLVTSFSPNSLCFTWREFCARWVSWLVSLSVCLKRGAHRHRAGCHVLALDLVMHWQFADNHSSGKHLEKRTAAVGLERPALSSRRRSTLLQRKTRCPFDLLLSKRLLSNFLSSIIADIPSAVVSRATSPEPEALHTTQEEEEREVVQRLAKQNRKQVTEVQAFDASAFGF